MITLSFISDSLGGHIFAPLLQQDITVPGTQKPGYLLEWYLKEPTAGTDSPLYTEVGTQGLMMFAYSLPRCVERGSYWLCITTTYKATKTATMQFGLAVLGRGRMFIDGKEVIDLFTSHPPKTAQSLIFNQCSMEVVADFDVTAGSEYQMTVTLVNGGIEAKAGAAAAGGARVSCCEKIDAAKRLQDAVELAKSVDVPIVIAGLNPDWESEAIDRSDLDLPESINNLIQALIQANPRTVSQEKGPQPIMTLEPD